MTVIHGDRIGTRAVGRPHTLAMADPNDPAVAVQLARRAMQGQAAPPGRRP
jgi:hypothetical protein